MQLLSLRTVLVATDLEATSDIAVRSAGALARVAGAALTVVHVLPTGANGEAALPEDAVDDALRRAGVKRDEASAVVVRGVPFTAIQAVADGVAADVIVLGPHRSRDGGEGRVLGSTAFGVVSGAHAPCLVLAEPLRMPLRRVLVPIDLSETARGALMVAQTWASALRARVSAELTVLHVERAPHSNAGEPAGERIENEIEVLRRTGGTWAGITTRAVTATGRDVASTIADHAADHDLVVLGTRGLGAEADGGEGLGSVASALIRRIRVPMLLVPPAVWRAYTADLQSAAGA